MYREQLIPCCPSGTPRLLDKDELAMETQQGAEGPDVEQKNHEAGGVMRGGDLFLIYLFWDEFYVAVFLEAFLKVISDGKKYSKCHFTLDNLSFLDILLYYRPWQYL